MKQVESTYDSPEGNTGEKGACSFQGVHDSAVAAAHDYDQTLSSTRTVISTVFIFLYKIAIFDCN